ncbi:hypothetical protein [Actinoplanes sp. CA-252034]|uniref:hypothetical protein n=1 Tax=Actinoplanes sp. CA-252034 TaxID=3239906 RepID=UPI003D95A400
MIFELQAALARHRRPVLAVATAPILAGLAARWLGTDPDDVMPWLFLVLLAATTLMLTVMWAPSVRRRMPVFLVDERERVFRTPEGGVDVATGVAVLALVGFLTPVPADLFDEDVLRTAAAVLLPLAAAGKVTAAWRTAGLTVSAAGLHAAARFGAMTVPWAALDDEQPDPTGGRITLELAEPGLVRTSGWVWRRVIVIESGREAEVAAAIRRYRAEPAERAAIGTRDGYARLLAALG